MTADQVESCEIVAVVIENINIINIVIYRPPDTCYNDFANVMKKKSRGCYQIWMLQKLQ